MSVTPCKVGTGFLFGTSFQGLSNILYHLVIYIHSQNNTIPPRSIPQKSSICIQQINIAWLYAKTKSNQESIHLQFYIPHTMSTTTTIQKNLNSFTSYFKKHKRAWTLVAVTKYQDLATTQLCIDLGISHIAESKVQVALQKKQCLHGTYTYHMIGHLQSNKVAQAVSCFDMIQSVDSNKLIHKLGKETNKQQRDIDILLQVNINQEDQKYWFMIWDIPAAIVLFSEYPYLHLQWCMCMWKQWNSSKTSGIFQQLRELCSINSLPICSMGMTQDRKIAIEHWSTILRIWSWLFT